MRSRVQDWFLEIYVCVCVCLCVCDWKLNIQRFISFPCFGENREMKWERADQKRDRKWLSQEWLNFVFSNSIIKHLFTCILVCISRLPQKNSLKPNFRFRKYVSRKNYSSHFLETAYSNSLLDIFLGKTVIYYRNIDGSPNLVSQI